MKQHVVCLFMLCAFSVFGQPDTEKKNAIKIPAIETKEKDTTPKLIIKPNSKINFTKVETKSSGISIDNKVSITKSHEEFSMFDKSELRKPGEMFEKRFNDIAVEQGLKEQPYGDQFLGSFKSRGKKLRLRFRDFGSEDGDYIRIFINKDIIVRSTMLTSGYQTYDLVLEEGMTYEIFFVALNQGEVGPNTAQLEVYDDNLGLLSSKHWNLRTGEKAIIEIKALGSLTNDEQLLLQKSDSDRKSDKNQSETSENEN